jgi:ketosteroid isomerase-like protein
MKSETVGIAHAFVGAINTGNADEIARLMPEDHVFVDSDGTPTHGRATMQEGWRQYFRMFPDYKISVEETLSRGPVVVMLGTADGTYAVGGKLLPENHWSVPAVWRAVIRDNAVLEWRVYVNVGAITEIISKHGT